MNMHTKTYQSFDERFAEGLDDMELAQCSVIVVKGRQKKDVLATDSILRGESACVG
jgi:hypothetical protein